MFRLWDTIEREKGPAQVRLRGMGPGEQREDGKRRALPTPAGRATLAKQGGHSLQKSVSRLVNVFHQKSGSTRGMKHGGHSLNSPPSFKDSVDERNFFAVSRSSG
jgi:hypothetical protein